MNTSPAPRRDRSLSAIPPTSSQRQSQAMTLMLVHHERIGAESPLSLLPHHLLQDIAELALRVTYRVVHAGSVSRMAYNGVMAPVMDPWPLLLRTEGTGGWYEFDVDLSLGTFWLYTLMAAQESRPCDVRIGKRSQPTSAWLRWDRVLGDVTGGWQVHNVVQSRRPIGPFVAHGATAVRIEANYGCSPHFYGWVLSTSEDLELTVDDFGGRNHSVVVDMSRGFAVPWDMVTVPCEKALTRLPELPDDEDGTRRQFLAAFAMSPYAVQHAARIAQFFLESSRCIADKKQ
eukprot:m51a1_g4184 hypothetical protein (288) ;mRNA; r:373426-374366